MKETQLDESYAIVAKGLIKSFRNNIAVDGVDLRVKKGTVYGFLGPNGAGKTTTVRMLATLLQPDAGSVKVLGFDLQKEADEVRSRVSLTGQFASVDEDLTGMENLVLIGRLLGFSRKEAKKRAHELLEAFSLKDAAKRQVKKYSGGMRRRLDIAASIVVTPELLFLDEPTTGLDPRSRNQVWSIIRSLVNAGTTVLLTTQYLDEADQLADRIAVIDEGKIIAEGTSSELKASIGTGTLNIRLLDPAQRALAGELIAEKLNVPIHLPSEKHLISAQVSNTTYVADALSHLLRNGIEITEFSLGQPSLDEVFLSLTSGSSQGKRDESSSSQKEAR
ncbi:ATP-binding cassette domain-containing protein [Evansella cellulosilytica]|uniref:Daunorubicin resistance ABC transporter ATPase subunit n=1 Tax=Evansella cellulosilytica (strain ATCC 21833 / DSM 2522 / FERM P-1141 / JCM 9156 / N-4) TaxID=649639 RepID=E6TZB2_EVAC2|nr:ATP-binding cassette domain-containing protein [Evansella cellulosilytica]ADU28974.1 daunorubicin resistance ABC transporter ATPase subunit [Evansella cellulosilytica DSM 2522]